MSLTSRDRGKEIRADQSDHELVVVPVEAVTLQAHVDGVARFAVAAAQHAVLHQDLALLGARQAIERPDPAQGIPDRPRVVRIEDVARHLAQQEVGQVRLAARRVGAAEHREVGTRRQGGEGPPHKQGAARLGEQRGVLVHQQHADAARVVEIRVDYGVEAAPLHGIDDAPGARTLGEHVKLHEEAALQRLRLSPHRRAVLTQIGRALLRRGGTAGRGDRSIVHRRDSTPAPHRLPAERRPRARAGRTPSARQRGRIRPFGTTAACRVST